MEEVSIILKEFYSDNKRIIIAVLIALILIITGIVVIMLLSNPVKINFTSDDSKVIATASTKLVFAATAKDKTDEKFEISWSINGGSINKNTGEEIVWDLPEEQGTYTITATVGKYKKQKKVTVLKNELSAGLTYNAKEVLSKDTDGDGLTDEYEKTISKTDLTKKDTDGDGLYDGDEISLGLSPLNSVSKADNTADSNRVLNYTMEDPEAMVSVSMEGKGNLTKTTVDKYSTPTITKMSQSASDIYQLFTEAALTQDATIKIKYNKELLSQKGIEEKNIALYRINDKENKFEKIDSTVDTQTANISAKVKTLGKFFIADSTKMKEQLSTEIMFVIDNSGSMYAAEEIATSKGNDPDFKRVDLPNRLIEKLKGDYKFGAGKFTFEYQKISDITTNKEEIVSKIDTMKTMPEKFTGTYIGEALDGGLNQFKADSKVDRKIVILLTDGKDTTNIKGYDRDRLKNASAKAKNSGVLVYTIGLGKDVDRKVLAETATITGGNTYYASNADTLQNLFEVISADLNYGMFDTDRDNVDDSVLVNDSTFIAKRDGLPIDNIANKVNPTGSTYGMTLLSKLYAENKLPLKLSDMSVKVPETSEVLKAQGYDLSRFTYIRGKDNNLYELKFEDMKFLTDESKVLRQQTTSGSNLAFKKEYKSEMEEKGFFIYNQTYTKKDSTFKTFENFGVDLNSEKFDKGIRNGDGELFKAIFRLDVLKYKDEMISFYDEPTKSFDTLNNSLVAGQSVLLKLNDNYTVLASKLILDNANPNKIKLEVYDSNYPGQIKYVDIERIKVNNISEEDKAKNGKYIYKFNYEGKQVSSKISIPNIEVYL